MSRIGKAYEARFRSLLLRVRARRLEAGVEWLLTRARERSAATGLPLTRTLGEVYDRLRAQVNGREERERLPDRFLCDAGLGGLARWLRASGYEAYWFPDIDDAELLRRARQLNATILTTDSLMMERGILRDGILPALWVPPTLTMHEQLTRVFREFGLEPREARCMRCGGELKRVDKESMREQIPPKTWLWIDEYFMCGRCGHLFWKGTHWNRIRRTIEAAA